MIDKFQLEELRRKVALPLTQPEEAILRAMSSDTLDSLLEQSFPHDGKIEAGSKIQSLGRTTGSTPNAPNPASIVGDLLCVGTNLISSAWLAGAGPAQLELVILDWFKDWLGCPSGTEGIITTGQCESDLIALMAAQERLSFEERSRAVLYVTDQRDAAIDRAAWVMGIPPQRICTLVTDGAFRCKPALLQEAVYRDRSAGKIPWALVACAGTNRTGAVDPLLALVELCQEEKLWLHVDAAYAWPAMLIPEGKLALEGIGLADSITLEPHQWFGQTLEAGCVLVREGTLLAETFGMKPDYLQDTQPGRDEINFGDRGPRLTRSFQALKIWFSVKALGMRWHRDFLQRCCSLAKFTQAFLEGSPAFEILSPAQLSVICFRYVPSPPWQGTEEELDQLNLALASEMKPASSCGLACMRLRDRVAFRFCFVDWRTTVGEIEEVVRALATIGDPLSSAFTAKELAKHKKQYRADWG